MESNGKTRVNTTYLNGKMSQTTSSSANDDEIARFDARIGDCLYSSISKSVYPIYSLIQPKPSPPRQITLPPLHPLPSHTLYAVNPAHSTGPIVLGSTPSGKIVK